MARLILFVVAGLFFINALCQQQPVAIGLWEPYLDGHAGFVKPYQNRREIKNNKDDDGNGIIDDINGCFFNNSGSMTGLPALVNDSVPADFKLHGYAVAYILTRYLSNYAIYHCGFTPTTERLSQTGILNLSVTERLAHFDAEMDFNDQFVQQTVHYFKQQGIKVVNMSFGISVTSFLANNTNLGHTADEAKLHARRWMNAFKNSFSKALANAPGILFITAAGNDGELMDSVIDTPASVALRNVIGVGALDINGRVAAFSNYGSAIAIYARGERVPVVMPDGQTELLDGTSLAVPLVTNAAVKLLQQRPGLAGAALKKALLEELRKPGYAANFLVPEK